MSGLVLEITLNEKKIKEINGMFILSIYYIKIYVDFVGSRGINYFFR